MADVESTAVLKIKADTSQAVSETKKLEAAQRSLGDALDKAKTAFASALGGLSTGLAGIGIAAGAVGEAISKYKAALDTGLDVERFKRLEASIPTSSINALSKATEGLYTRMDVVRLASRGMTGDFALNESQMGKLLRAAQDLEAKGFGPAEQTAARMIDKLSKGVQTFDDFGISLQKTGNQQRDLNALMDKFDEIHDKTAPITEREKAIKQSINEIKEFGHQIAVLFTDYVLPVLQAVARAIGTVLGAAKDAVGWARGAIGGASDWLAGIDRSGNSPELQAKHNAFVARQERRRDEIQSMRQAWLQDNLGPLIAPYIPDASATGFASSAFDSSALDSLVASQRPRARVRQEKRIRGVFDPGGISGPLGAPSDPFSGISAFDSGNWTSPESGFGAAAFDSSALDALEMQQRNEELASALSDTTTMAGAAFATMSAGLSAAVDAAISGSDSIGRAFLKASAAALKALAVESAVRALYHTAMFFGTRDPNHLAAAGKFAATAAVAGVGSAALSGLSGGAGAASGASAGSGSNFGRPYSSGGGGGGDTIVVNVYGDYYGKKGQLQEEIAKGVREGQRRGGTGSYSVSFQG